MIDMNHNGPCKDQNAVAITGMGIISSCGEGIQTFKNALKYGQSHFIRSNGYPNLAFPVLGAFLPEIDIHSSLLKFPFLKDQQLTLNKTIRSTSYPILLALIAALEACQQSSLSPLKLNNERIGLIVAAQNSTTNYQYNLYDKFKEEPEYLSPTYALKFMDSDYVGTLSEILRIRGEGFTVGAASASGNVALLRAYQLIENRGLDIAIVIGALADLSPMELQGFHNIGALGGHRFANEPNKACRPFDKAHEGFIYGQAVACLVLESVDSIRQRNIPALAYILGGSLVLDGNRLSNPSQEGELRSMQKAINLARISVNDIDYINTHGTSSPIGDQTEVDAIEKLLGKRSLNVALNSTKSITGHCLWSAGVVEAIATIIQMQEGFIHPSLNLENPITQNSHFAIKPETFQIQTALSNAFGFGGFNSTIVLSNKIK